MEIEIFDFICSEFNGIQRQRALKIFYDGKISKEDLRLFYSNWLVHMKFELKNWLNDYQKLYNRYRLLKRNIRKYNDINNTNIIVLANYTVECKELEIRMEELEDIITSTGNEIFLMVEKIEELCLFNSNDIATVFSIPLSIIINYKDNNLNKIFNVVITYNGEKVNLNNQKACTDLSLMPFYWSKNMAYFNLLRS